MGKKSTATPEPLEKWLPYRFALISARLGVFAAPLFRDRYDLPQAVGRTLAVIARYQPLSASELASHTSYDAFKVARSIDMLLRRTLIRRDAAPKDRR